MRWHNGSGVWSPIQAESATLRHIFDHLLRIPPKNSARETLSPTRRPRHSLTTRFPRAFRFIHTADWHLGQIFHGHDRELEHRYFLDWLLATLQEKKPDALLLAGDVFDTVNSAASAQRLFYCFLAQVRTTLPHLQILITAGNHDAAARLEASSDLLASLDISVLGTVARTARAELARTLTERQSAAAHLDDLEKSLREVELRRNTCEAKKVQSEAALASLTTELKADEAAAATESLRTLEEKLAVTKNHLGEARLKHEAATEKLAAQELKAGPWIKLNELLGSADGAKFRALAQRRSPAGSRTAHHDPATQKNGPPYNLKPKAATKD